MTKTISFVATDKLAEWIEEESERRMTTVSTTAQQLLAEKFRGEQDGGEMGKPVQRGSEGGALESESLFVFKSKSAAETARQQFAEHLSDDDDGRLKEVRIAQGTPQGAVDELGRWAESVENGP